MITDTVRFWSFLVFLIPSFFCALFVLYQLLSDRALRNALNNHVIIVLLFICLFMETTIYPWMLYHFQHEDTWERPLMLCTVWGWIDWGFYVIHTLLFAWAMIERHILIFHDGWVSTKKKRVFVHYLPLIGLLVFYLLFYIAVYFFPPCQNYYIPSAPVCMFPCAYDSYTFSMFDFLAEQILPVLIIAIFSIGLLVRVLWRKNRMRRTIHWGKHRKMAIQALSISALYLLILLPYAIVYILGIYAPSSPVVSNVSSYTVFFSYFIILLFPFVSALSLPELQTRAGKIFHLRRQAGRIVPIIVTVRNRANDHTHNQ